MQPSVQRRVLRSHSPPSTAETYESYLFPELLRPADLLPHRVRLLQRGLQLLLLVPELACHLLLLGTQLRHALIELRELLQGQLPLLVGISEFLGLGLEAL